LINTIKIQTHDKIDAAKETVGKIIDEDPNPNY
jgi:hypothetical protein